MWPKGGRQIKGSETWKGLSSGKTGTAEPYSPNKDVLGGTVVKNLPVMWEPQEMMAPSLGWENLLE